MTAAIRRAEFVQENVLSRMWRAILLKGLLAAAFAFLAYFWLGKSLPGLILLFAGYAFIDGLCSLVAARRGGGLLARLGLAGAGLTGVAAGAVALLPDLTWDGFATVIAGWALVRGGFELASSLSLRRFMYNDWSLALAAVLAIVFGVSVILAPPVEPWTFVRLLATLSLVTGALFLLLSVRFARGMRP